MGTSWMFGRRRGRGTWGRWWAPSLEGAHGQAAHELPLGGPAGEQDREAGQRGGGGQLRPVQALTGDEADEEHRDGGGPERGQVEREEEFVPGEDQADQGGRGD